MMDQKLTTSTCTSLLDCSNGISSRPLLEDRVPHKSQQHAFFFTLEEDLPNKVNPWLFTWTHAGLWTSIPLVASSWSCASVPVCLVWLWFHTQRPLSGIRRGDAHTNSDGAPWTCHYSGRWSWNSPKKPSPSRQDARLLTLYSKKIPACQSYRLLST